MYDHNNVQITCKSSESLLSKTLQSLKYHNKAVNSVSFTEYPHIADGINELNNKERNKTERGFAPKTYQSNVSEVLSKFKYTSCKNSVP